MPYYKKVTLGEAIIAAATLKRAKWEHMGGWKDPGVGSASSPANLYLEDISQRPAAYFDRNDPARKIRHSIKRHAVHREMKRAHWKHQCRRQATTIPNRSPIGAQEDFNASYLRRQHDAVLCSIRNISMQQLARAANLVFLDDIEKRSCGIQFSILGGGRLREPLEENNEHD